MGDSTSGLGSTILTVAIAAGWVAVGALILRTLLSGIKFLVDKFNNEDGKSISSNNKPSKKGF